MSPAAGRIADLNDLLRSTFLSGKVVLTEGIANLEDAKRSRVIEKVQGFDAFTQDNDPYGEHDFGSINVAEVGKVFWKIDYYDRDYTFHSSDATDPTKTRRVLTIMLASEY